MFSIFDVLTESKVDNDKSGGQLVTITDPVTGKRRTLTTYTKGKGPDIIKRSNPSMSTGNF